MLVIQLIYNIALLVTTSIISGFIDTRWSRKVSTGKILQGITFGFIAILAMLNPFVLSPGVIFDGRSIVLSLCALFFGPVAGIISGSMALVTRLLIGGGGALMGVSVIISSVLIGLVVHLSKRDDVYKLKAKNLYLFGIVVHIAMLLLMMLLPVNFVLITFQTIAVSVIVFYPAATVIIGKILIDHQNNINHVNELKESEERFRTLYEDAPIGFYRATPEGKLLLANKALLKMLGFTSIDELNKHFDRAADRPYYQQPQFLEEIGKNNEIKNIETKWMRTDGKTIVMKGHAKAIRDYLGNILYYDGTVEDITEQKKAQDQVRLHAALSEISPLAISVLDLEGNTLYANQKTIELYGYTHGEFMSLNVKQLDTAISAELFEQKIKEIKKTGEVFLEVKHLRKDGTTIPMEVFIKLIDWNGIPVLLSLANDITQRKQSELELIRAKNAAITANKLKDAFISNMSHEIRTPLNGILGMSSIIQQIYVEFAKEDNKDLFTSIEISSKRLINTVDKILNFSRLQTGEFPIRNKGVSIFLMLKKLVAEYSGLASGKSIALNLHVSTDDAMVYADEASLHTVFDNLIDNAVKFTSEGSVNIFLYRNAQQKLCVDINDTGTGISEEYLTNLFEPYSQEGIGYNRPYEGLGLGLAIVKKLVLLNNATIKVESKKSEGTVFKICFDAAEVLPVEPEPEIFREMKTHNSIAPLAGKPAILVVEDDVINQLYIRTVLKNDYEVVLASGAAKALQLFGSRSFDLILMDISLKDNLNGLELTKSIRSGQKDPQIPIIAITGHVFPEDYKKAIESGCNEYLAKPFKGFQLIDKIKCFIPR